jgi:hypothetical protein
MPPLFANFSLERLTQVFNAHGIHALEIHSDDMVIWGDAPMSDEKYKGRFFPGHVYIPGRYSIYTVREIVKRLGKSAELDAIEHELFQYGSEGLGV